jgi:predicted RNA-binding Zn ribbon-like protein
VSIPPDPRPLLGEPLAIDLLNTRWGGVPAPNDLFTRPRGLEIWLAGNDLTSRAQADEPTLAALLQARDALAEAVVGSAVPSSPERLDAVLGHGRIRRTAAPDGPADTVEVDDPAWLPAWLAVDDYLSLLVRGPFRIRQCAHESCVLRFFDTSQNGRRRWCSMAGCGNRAKASRHYAQQHPGRRDAVS